MEYIVYGHHECPWCDKAQELLLSEGLSYSYYNVRSNPEARAAIMGMGLDTVPQIFKKSIHDEYQHIGGYDQLKDSLNG